MEQLNSVGNLVTNILSPSSGPSYYLKGIKASDGLFVLEIWPGEEESL